LISRSAVTLSPWLTEYCSISSLTYIICSSPASKPVDSPFGLYKFNIYLIAFCVKNKTSSVPAPFRIASFAALVAAYMTCDLASGFLISSKQSL